MQAPPEYKNNVYYDIQISNVSGDSAPAPALNFYECRSQPYLENSGLYDMQIIRFEINTPSLPIFLPEIQLNQSDPNLTIYSVTLSYKGIDFQSFIEYVPQNVSIPVPLGPSNNQSKLQDNSYRYYNVYSFQWFVNMVNQAFVNAMTALINSNPAGGLPSQNTPFMNWDIGSNCAILNADQAGFQSDMTNPIGIYFNGSLYNLYSSFMAINQGYQAINGKNYQLVVNDFTTGSNTIQLPIVNPTYTGIQIYQEYTTISLFSPISSLCFISNNLPVTGNQLSNPAVYSNGQLISSSTSANYSKIITDMIANDSFYKPTLVYEPTIYRKIEMQGNSQLRDIQITVQWKDKQGNYHDFFLNSACSASIKLLFTLKPKYINL